MATIEQLSAALVKADAAGNTADAKVFANALRAMKAQGGGNAPAAPGTREYADWAAAQARAGKALPSVPGYEHTSAQPQAPNLMDSTLATVNGLTGSVPGLQQASDAILAGGQSVGDLATGKPVDFGARYGQIQQQRQAVADKAPLADVLGGLGGTVAGAGALGATKLGAEALGMSGKFGKQLLNSSLSTAGYEGLQGLTHGHTGGQLLADEGTGAAGGLAGFGAGKVLKGIGQKTADVLTSGAQNKATSAAIAGAPDVAALKSAGSQYFEKAFGGDIPAVSDTAIMRFVGSVRDAVAKYRPNEHTTPQAVGLLQHMMELADAANTPGTVVDLKDLHILRQTANMVRQSAKPDDETTKTIAGKVISQLDGFIKGLKPSDILGAADPREAGNALMKGISTWAKASKVNMIEQAIEHAKTYKSGYENGLKLSFLNLMKTPEFARLSKLEQAAIEQVAKGTTRQNIAEGLGKLGFSLGGNSAHNILGGTAGTGILTTALSPILGPAAFPVALGTTSAVGAAGRHVAERIGDTGARRAAQIMATSNIPVVPQMINPLLPAVQPLNLLARGAVVAGAGR